MAERVLTEFEDITFVDGEEDKGPGTLTLTSQYALCASPCSSKSLIYFEACYEHLNGLYGSLCCPIDASERLYGNLQRANHTHSHG